MVIFVLSATVILISLGIGKSTGCENPSERFRVWPWTAALNPTPSISKFFVNPSLTPRTMLFTSARESPWSAFALRVSAARANETLSFSTLAEMSRGSFQFSFPFGPSTAMAPSVPTFTFTFAGSTIVLFPIRDIQVTKRMQAVHHPHFVSSLPVPTALHARWRELRHPFRQVRAAPPGHRHTAANPADSLVLVR